MYLYVDILMPYNIFPEGSTSSNPSLVSVYDNSYIT
jgi:hypothetical protein